MWKKIITILTILSLCATTTNTVFAMETNEPESQAEFIKTEGNASIYLDGNKILKVVVDNPEPIAACNETLISEGVIPQTSSLYWHTDGSIYVNGTFSKDGSLGSTKNYSTPTFSNVTLMSSNQSIDPISAGATYTLNCSRGVTINVYIQLV